MTEEQIRKAYLDFQENNPIRHCSLEAQLLEFGKVCAIEATKMCNDYYQNELDNLYKDYAKRLDELREESKQSKERNNGRRK